MNQVRRIHILAIAFILAVAAVAGLSAALRTTHLGAASRGSQPSTAALLQRSRELARLEQRLRAKRPAGSTQRVVYVRPAPIVHTIHRAGEHDDGGGEFGD